MIRSRRLRALMAFALSLCLAAALVPWYAFAQSGDYSGEAEGTAAEVTIAPGTGAETSATVGESTGAVNSDANIIPDSPGSPEDESDDYSVGTATPIRVESPVLDTAPGSVQSSAPGDAGGSSTVVDVDAGPVTVDVGVAETDSTATVDGEQAATENHTEVTNAVVDGAASLGAATSDADVSRSADGTITAFAQSSITEPSSLLGGLITVEAISASSESSANGTVSENLIDFLLANLALRTAPDTDPVVSFDAGPSADPDLVDVTLTIGPLSETFTLPRGSNLLDASNYDGSSAAFAAALDPVLDALTGPGGPLEGSEIILAGGFSEDGDGTFARGLVEVLRVTAALADGTVIEAVLGRAFTGVDAERPYSNVTDPDTPLGEEPATDPDDAFQPTKEATPAEEIFTNPVQDAGGPGDGPGEPGGGATVPEGPGEGLAPADGSGDGPGAGGDAEEAASASADADRGELAFTGLPIAPVAGIGLLLLGTGRVARYSARQRAGSADR